MRYQVPWYTFSWYHVCLPCLPFRYSFFSLLSPVSFFRPFTSFDFTRLRVNIVEIYATLGLCFLRFATCLRVRKPASDFLAFRILFASFVFCILWFSLSFFSSWSDLRHLFCCCWYAVPSVTVATCNADYSTPCNNNISSSKTATTATPATTATLTKYNTTATATNTHHHQQHHQQQHHQHQPTTPDTTINRRPSQARSIPADARQSKSRTCQILDRHKKHIWF